MSREQFRQADLDALFASAVSLRVTRHVGAPDWHEVCFETNDLAIIQELARLTTIIESPFEVRAYLLVMTTSFTLVSEGGVQSKLHMSEVDDLTCPSWSAAVLRHPVPLARWLNERGQAYSWNSLRECGQVDDLSQAQRLWSERVPERYRMLWSDHAGEAFATWLCPDLAPYLAIAHEVSDRRTHVHELLRWFSAGFGQMIMPGPAYEEVPLLLLLACSLEFIFDSVTEAELESDDALALGALRFLTHDLVHAPLDARRLAVRARIPRHVARPLYRLATRTGYFPFQMDRVACWFWHVRAEVEGA